MKFRLLLLFATCFVFYNCSNKKQEVQNTNKKKSINYILDVENDTYLKHIAYFDKSTDVRKIATRKITSEEILSHIAKFDKDQDVRRIAVYNLTKTK